MTVKQEFIDKARKTSEERRANDNKNKKPVLSNNEI